MSDTQPAGPGTIAAENGQSARLQVEDVLHGRLSTRQWLILAVCFAAAFVDGADRQGIGLVARNIMASLHISATELGFVFALDNLGAVIGAVVCGRMCDRHGCRPVMLATMAIIALCTLLSAHAGSFHELAAVRFAGGLGLGGAVPAFLTLASEYVPSRLRGTVAAVVFAGYPVGAAFGGLWSAYLLAHHSWQTVFYVGAFLPVVIFVLTATWLPESIRFLMRTHRIAAATKIAHWLKPELRDRPFTLVPDVVGEKRMKTSAFRALFSDGLAGPTILLWVIYFFLFATLKVVVTWLPSILSGNGISPSSAALVQGIWNVGSVTGELLALRLLQRFGPSKTMVPALFLVGTMLCLIGINADSLPMVLLTTIAAGLGVGISVSGVIAATATLYPSEQRGTGMGSGMAASRFGQVISPVLIALMIDQAVGIEGVMYVIGAMPLLAALAVWPFNRAVSRRSERQPVPVSA